MTKREAAHSTALLWATAAREPVYILEKGKPRYRIEAIDQLDPLDELERRGLLTRAAAEPRPFTPPSSRRYTRAEAADLLDDLRDER